MKGFRAANIIFVLESDKRGLVNNVMIRDGRGLIK